MLSHNFRITSHLFCTSLNIIFLKLHLKCLFFIQSFIIFNENLVFYRKATNPILTHLCFYFYFYRLIPVYVFVIMFMFMGNVLGSGPIWHDSTHKYIQACYDNWWTNLLFINNFYDAEHMVRIFKSLMLFT